MREFILTIGSIILGLIILALAAGALYGGFNTGKASNLVTEITLIETNARAGFAQSNQGYANFTTTNESTLASGGMFPTNLVRSGTLYDEWGNEMSISSANNSTQGVITFGGGVSQTVDQCKTVVMGLKDYVNLAVGTTNFTQTNQPDAVSATTACSGNPSLALTFQ